MLLLLQSIKEVCKKFLGVDIYPPNYEASYPRGQYSFNSLENFYKDLLIVSESYSYIFPMHKQEFICGQFESRVLCIEPESDIIIEISQYFIQLLLMQFVIKWHKILDVQYQPYLGCIFFFVCCLSEQEFYFRPITCNIFRVLGTISYHLAAVLF